MFDMVKLFKLQKCIVALLLVTFLIGMLLGIRLITNMDDSAESHEKKKDSMSSNPITKQAHSKETKEIIAKPEKITKDKGIELQLKKVEDTSSESQKWPKPNYNMHAFYYPWYGNPKFDQEYLHWNHPYLPHWNKKEAQKWSDGRHEPPDDIGANFFPELGAYSSRDPEVIDNHMQQMRSAGIGVLAVSWYPPDNADDNGKAWDDLMPTLLDAAHKYELKVCFHIEPYKKRNHKTIRANVQYIIEHYGSHSAFYRRLWHGKELPLYYIYDSYLVGKDAWGSVFRKDGEITVRDTDLDGIFIGLLVEDKHRMELNSAGFDGFYTYFASDGFSHGSSTRHWPTIAKYATANKMLFIPSVGPGYVDVRVRPWNGPNTKDRENGGYYEQSFKAALGVNPPIVSITSFNEWHEGTQIEKAIPKEYPGYKYQDYKPMESDYYLILTRKYSHKYRKLRGKA